MTKASPRTKLFISKATPGDDAFALWLATRLEAEGYEVFADILDLDAGDGWRRKITASLQDKAVKMLLCCSDETLSRAGVMEEIEIASDLVRSIPDPNFIIPLKLKRYKKVFGIAGLQYIDFEDGWAQGLSRLLKSLARQGVPKLNIPKIQPEWAAHQRRMAVKLINEPEVLTSNWLRILSVPDEVRLIAPKGATSAKGIKELAQEFPYPIVPHEAGFITFAALPDFDEHFLGIGSFETLGTVTYTQFSEAGWPEQQIEQVDARRMIVNLIRQGWESNAKAQGFGAFEFSNGTAYIVTAAQIGLNKRVLWGRQGQERRSALRNRAKKYTWEYGASAQPSLFPFPHIRLKGRVLFSVDGGTKKGEVIDDHKVQHRLRRSVAGSWRNRAWHGRMMAYLELLAGESPFVTLRVGLQEDILIDASPILATSPVTARNTNDLGEDAEETDATTLGGHFDEDEA